MLAKLAVLCLACVAATSASAQSVITASAILESYVGAYQTASGGITRVMLQRSQLVREDSAGRKTRLIAQSENVFLAESDGVRFEFVRDGAGKISHLLLTGPSTRDEAIRVQVTHDVLVRYVGTYTISDLDLVIALEGNRLIAQITGQVKMPMFAESPTKFFVQDYNSEEVAELEFGADRGLVYVVLRQNGNEAKVMKN